MTMHEPTALPSGSWHVVMPDGSCPASFGWNKDPARDAINFARWWGKGAVAVPSRSPDLHYACKRCGQTASVYGHAEPFTCGPCQDADRAPQGEAVRLFEPAPTQLAGQLTL